MKEKQFTALTHENCPICGNSINESILIHKQLRDISELHNKSTGYATKPCEECQKIFDLGAIALIIADQSKSGKTPEELYRCGVVFGMSEDWVRRCLSGDMLENVLKTKVMVMDYQDAKAIGLEVNYPKL